jgi:uncharacterized membrane protein YcgQ (UPF0703/DUF1980 family)
MFCNISAYVYTLIQLLVDLHISEIRQLCIVSIYSYIAFIHEFTKLIMSLIMLHLFMLEHLVDVIKNV